MPIPETVDLPGSDEPTLDAVALQEFDVGRRLVDVVAEHPSRCRTHRGSDAVQAHYIHSLSAAFHVKRARLIVPDAATKSSRQTATVDKSTPRAESTLSFT
ncbi:hypothetical protein GCM10023192_75440 [Amycolatopsis samaneae]